MNISQNFFVRLIINSFLKLLKVIGKVNTFIVVTVIYFSVILMLSFYYKLLRWITRVKQGTHDSAFVKIES